MLTMQLDIVTAEGVTYSDQVSVVVAPGVEGELGILPNHTQLLTILQPGELRIVKDGEDDTLIALGGGFLEVMKNRVVILADTAERADDIDESRAEDAVNRAREQLDNRTADMDLERALASLRRSQTRLKVVRRRRERSGPSLNV